MNTHHNDLHKYRTAPQGVWQHIHHSCFTDGENVQDEKIYVDGGMPPTHHSEVEGLKSEVTRCVLEARREHRSVTSAVNEIMDLLTSHGAKEREAERERIEAIFKKHVPPHAMDLENSVWLKRLLNKAFEHENIHE